SAELWPALAEELGDVGYTQCGSLVLAFDERELDGAFAGAGRLDGKECRALEPGISNECVGALVLDGDAQVDPPRAVQELAARVDDLRTHADVVQATPSHVVLADGTRVEADTIVLAGGAWLSRRLARRLPLRPVKGQTLRLRGPLPATRIIRSEHV